jgi:hypothetical protein
LTSFIFRDSARITVISEEPKLPLNARSSSPWSATNPSHPGALKRPVRPRRFVRRVALSAMALPALTSARHQDDPALPRGRSLAITKAGNGSTFGSWGDTVVLQACCTRLDVREISLRCARHSAAIRHVVFDLSFRHYPRAMKRTSLSPEQSRARLVARS